MKFSVENVFVSALVKIYELKSLFLLFNLLEIEVVSSDGPTNLVHAVVVTLQTSYKMPYLIKGGGRQRNKTRGPESPEALTCRSPLNSVKIGQGQLRLIIKHILL